MIAGGRDELLARRATIILMSETNVRPVNIAKEVEVSPRTVKRWLSAFEQKRLGIFPELAGELIKPAPVPEAVAATAGAPATDGVQRAEPALKQTLTGQPDEGKKAKVKKNEPL